MQGIPVEEADGIIAEFKVHCQIKLKKDIGLKSEIDIGWVSYNFEVD